MFGRGDELVGADLPLGLEPPQLLQLRGRPAAVRAPLRLQQVLGASRPRPPRLLREFLRRRRRQHELEAYPRGRRIIQTPLDIMYTDNHE